MPTPPEARRTGRPAYTNDVLRAVADEHRRRVLYYLREADGVASVEELTADLTAGTDTDTADIAVRLHHVILPQLADVGVIAFNRDDERVRYAGGSFVTELIDWIRDRERSQY